MTAVFIPGNLLLCEDCRAACVRAAKKAKTGTRDHYEDKDDKVDREQERQEVMDAGRQSGNIHDATSLGPQTVPQAVIPTDIPAGAGGDTPHEQHEASSPRETALL